MQKDNSEIKINTEYVDLVLGLSTFLVRTNKEIQRKIVSFPMDLYLTAIMDNNLDLDVRKMACSALKLKINQISKTDIKTSQRQELLAKLESMFTLKLQEKHSQKNLQKIQNTMEVVFEKVFQKFYDDSQKISLFEQSMESLCQKQIESHEKTLRILQLLVRSMYFMSLNNQVLIGQLNLYLIQIVNNKNSYQGSIWIEVVIQTLKFMKELNDIVEINDQQQDNIIMEYMRTNTQMKQVFFKILCLTDNSVSSQIIQIEQKSMICKNARLNKIKSQLLQLWAQIWMYGAESNLLELIIGTILKVNKRQIVDDVEGILINCVVILQRSVTDQQYNQMFYKMTQALVLKLFQIISINQTQYNLIEADPTYFIQIMDDFCRKQELELLKTRAGSLLVMLALAVDGYLTFITHLALVAMRQLQQSNKNQVEIGLWNTFKQNFNGSQQAFIQVSILILSCISDQIDKRNDLKISIYMHLQNMTPIFQQGPLSKLVVLRYMQSYAYYSYPGCLDVFISHYSNQPIYEQQLLKCYQTLMSYHDKKNRQMEVYVKHLTDHILLLSTYLTPLLEQAIMVDKNMIKSFKQKTLQKLIDWLVSFYKKEEILKITKISTLIIKLLHSNLPSVLNQQQFSPYKPFQITFLNQQLLVLQKLLIQLKFHPAQQCIVDICISHMEYLWNDQTNCKMTYDLAKDFFEVGVLLVERNNIVLNRCLMFFNTLLCPKLYNKQSNYIKNQIINHFSSLLLGKISYWLTSGQNFDERTEDLWQMIQLSQIALYQCNPVNCQENIDKVSYQILAKYQSTRDQIVKHKCLIVLILIISLRPQDWQKYEFLNSIKLPSHAEIMVYECRGYCFYLIKLLQNYKSLFPKQYRMHLIQIIIDSIYHLDSQKMLIFNYQQVLFINGDATSINAFKKNVELNLPIKQVQINLYECFRNMIKGYGDKSQLIEMDSQGKHSGKISDIAGKISVGDRTRKKLTVDRKAFN